MRTMIIAVSLLIGFTSYGDTLAWWRFEDLGAEGGKTSAETVLANSANGSMYAASPRSFKNQETPGTDAAYMPSLTMPFKSYGKLYVYDPASGESFPAAGALSCPWGGDGSGLSGGAAVPISGALCGVGQDGVQGDFTFECFFRTTRAGLDRSASMQPIACVPNPDGYIASWSLIIYSKHLWCRASAYKNNGSFAEIMTGNQAGAEVTPDVWHHAAVVYKASEKTFELYLDYSFVSKKAFSDEFSGKIAFKPDGMLYLGKGTYQNDRSFDGEIAEARFSSAALGTERFLRLRESSNADRKSSDPAVLAWYSLDHLDYGRSFFLDNPDVQQKDDSSFFATVLVSDGGQAAEISATQLPGFDGIVRGAVSGVYGSGSFANAGSAAFFTNETSGAYLSVSDAGGRIGSGSFTAECFFKTAHRPLSGDSYNWSYGIMGNDAFKIIIDKSSGLIFCRPSSSDGIDHGANLGTYRVDDGKWHHLAFVYDASTTEVSVYLDYCRLTVIGGIVFPASTLGADITFGVSRQGDGVAQKFDGWIDEARLTGRALSVEDFIAASPKTADGVLVRIPFDGDARLLPYGLSGRADAHVTATDKLPEAIGEGAGRCLAAGPGGEEVLLDAGACRFEGGKLAFPHIAAVEKSGVTIEFFWRPFEKFAPWPSVLGLSGDCYSSIEMAQSKTGGIWNFFYVGTWSYAQLRFEFACSDGAGSRAVSYIAASKSFAATDNNHQSETPGWREAEFDGKWHHVAVTIEEVAGDGGDVRTRVTSYFDYKMHEQKEVSGRLCTTGKSGLVMQESNGSGNRLSTWDIDEVRITGRILDASEFCRKISAGTVIRLK